MYFVLMLCSDWLAGEQEDEYHQRHGYSQGETAESHQEKTSQCKQSLKLFQNLHKIFQTEDYQDPVWSEPGLVNIG